MMIKHKTILSILVMLTLPFLAVAHPGHGNPSEFGLEHYFSTSLHLFISFGMAVVIIIAAHYLLKNKKDVAK